MPPPRSLSVAGHEPTLDATLQRPPLPATSQVPPWPSAGRRTEHTHPLVGSCQTLQLYHVLASNGTGQSQGVCHQPPEPHM